MTENSFVGAWLIFLVWIFKKISKFFDQKNDHWRHVAYLDIKSGALINFFTVLEVNRAVLNSQKIIFDNFLHHLQIQIRRKSKWEMNQSEAFNKEQEYATQRRWFNWILLRLTGPTIAPWTDRFEPGSNGRPNHLQKFVDRKTAMSDKLVISNVRL